MTHRPISQSRYTFFVLPQQLQGRAQAGNHVSLDLGGPATGHLAEVLNMDKDYSNKKFPESRMQDVCVQYVHSRVPSLFPTYAHRCMYTPYGVVDYTHKHTSR